MIIGSQYVVDEDSPMIGKRRDRTIHPFNKCYHKVTNNSIYEFFTTGDFKTYISLLYNYSSFVRDNFNF